MIFYRETEKTAFGGEDIFVSEFKNNMWQLAVHWPKNKYRKHEFINRSPLTVTFWSCSVIMKVLSVRGDNFYVEKNSGRMVRHKTISQPLILHTGMPMHSYCRRQSYHFLFRKTGGIGIPPKGDCFHDMYWEYGYFM